MKTNKYVVSIKAECIFCGKTFDCLKNGQKQAAEHAKKHKHFVTGEKVLLLEYNGTKS